MKRSKRLNRLRRDEILQCTPLDLPIALEENTSTGTVANSFIFSPPDILSVKSHKLFSLVTVGDG
jgi:hypothetical protein